ncbi:unnamed protein product [Zymoseptoria tritici ST99CH_3D1]|nr:unnamed protein product [Zymoseptoria tritici ST99CH_3D1]
MEKPSPPPYTSIGHGPSSETGVDEGNALIDHLTKRANEHLALDADYPVGAQESLGRETERIRNMLEFTLSVDYKRNAGASISAADREHFVHLAEAFRLFRRDPRDDGKPRKADPDTEERRIIVAFFIKYLHEPCKALLLPLDSVYDCIIFLSRYTDRSGRYKGSVTGQFYDYGVEGLASKLYMDRTILIPRVFTDIVVRNLMIDGVKAIEERFFDRISGIESSTVVPPGIRGF